jgi:hypothetical protein
MMLAPSQPIPHGKALKFLCSDAVTGNGGGILAGTNAGKQAVGLINGVVRDEFQGAIASAGACVASTGAEFVTMMNGANCVLIQLLPGTRHG